MKLFESDNIWKRNARARSRANRPDTPANRLEDARSKFFSDCLWLFAAAGLLVMGLLGIKLGIVAPQGITLVFLVVLALYVALNLLPLSRSWQAYKALRDEQKK